MGIVSRIGRWLDKHFPEKMSVEEVKSELDSFSIDLKLCNDKIDEILKRVITLEKSDRIQDDQLISISTIKDDLNKVKAIMQLKATQRVNMPDLSGSGPWKR